MQRFEHPQPGLFVVSRTSSSLSKPCDEAFEAETMQVDRRNVDDPKKIPANRGTDGDWYSIGTNHRIVDGNICRDIGYMVGWFAKIDDPLTFADKYGPCIIGRDHRGFATIEIYDDCRE